MLRGYATRIKLETEAAWRLGMRAERAASIVGHPYIHPTVLIDPLLKELSRDLRSFSLTIGSYLPR